MNKAVNVLVQLLALMKPPPRTMLGHDTLVLEAARPAVERDLRCRYDSRQKAGNVTVPR